MTEHDERLSRLYRAGPQDSPGELADARIRQAARAAITPRKRRPRWLAPLATAATVVLAVGVLLRVGIDVPPHAPPPDARSAVPAQAPTGVVAEPMPTIRDEEAASVRQELLERARQTEVERQRPASVEAPRRAAKSMSLEAPARGMSPPGPDFDEQRAIARPLAAQNPGQAFDPEAWLALDRDSLLARLATEPASVWRQVITALHAAGRHDDAAFVEGRVADDASR